MRSKSRKPAHLLLIALSLAILNLIPAHTQTSADVLLLQSQAEADRKSAGCITCHTATDSATMYLKDGKLFTVSDDPPGSRDQDTRGQASSGSGPKPTVP